MAYEDLLGIARDALKDIIIHLQGQVIANLKVQWQQDVYVDFGALQDVSDATQDQAVMVLLQLQQRIITVAPIKNLKPAPLFSNPDPLGMRNLAHTLPHITATPSFPSPASISKFPAPPPSYQPSSPPSESPRPSTALSQAPLIDTGSEKKGHFASLTKIGIFRRASKADHASRNVVSFPAESKAIIPFSGDHYNEAGPIRNSKNRPDDVVSLPKQLTRFNSVSTASSGVFGTEPDSPEFHPWKFPKPSSSSLKSHPSVSSASHYSRTTSGSFDAPPPHPSAAARISLDVKDLLPNEANQYAGFCKGAWRLQIGDRKKAMMERQRPVGLYSATPYWQCSKCRFEGRLVHDKKRAGYDTRVMIAEGVQFRWVFLFKSHVKSRDDMRDPMQASFGCIFCCAEGRGTPTFGGVRSLMAHLQEHRDRLPRGEVLYRMNCLVGRRAGPDEDFDINLIGRTMEEL